MGKYDSGLLKEIGRHGPLPFSAGGGRSIVLRVTEKVLVHVRYIYDENVQHTGEILNDRLFFLAKRKYKNLLFSGMWLCLRLSVTWNGQSNGCWCSKNPTVVHESSFTWP
jgi:hypothetical protein